MSKSSKKVASPKRLKLSFKPTLVLTTNIQNQIDFLHKKVTGVEWSGELITREEGSINDPENWKIICEDVFLCDIGTAAYTSYELGEGSWTNDDVMDMYDQFPGLVSGTHKQQHIHSHVAMGVFFSGTDEEQFEERGACQNYLLMLIVNNKGEACAKVGFQAKYKTSANTQLEFLNNSDGYSPIVIEDTKDIEAFIEMDCKIQFEEGTNIAPTFLERYKKVHTENSKPSYNWATYSFGNGAKAYKGTGFGFNKSDGSTTESVEEYDKRKAREKKEGTTKQTAIRFSNALPELEKRQASKASKKETKVASGDDIWDDDESIFNTYATEGVKESDKRISDMTDEEWNRFNSNNVTHDEVHMFINSLISDNFSGKSIYSFERLKQLSNKECEKFLKTLYDDGRRCFHTLFPSTANTYDEMLDKVVELLSPYKSYSIVAAVIRLCERITQQIV